MATLHRARVCMIGSEEDMRTLCRVMLENYGNPDDEDDDLPPTTLTELHRQVLKLAREDGAEFDTFLYHMISEMRYGSAEPGTLRFELTEQPCGLWTACFAYDSQSEFQTHEWLDLHNRAGGMLTVIQRVSWDFGLEKGEIILSGGQVLENWDYMGECWLWLMHKYECGYPPEEAVERLKKLQKTMEREDFDMTVSELLASCEENLIAIAEAVQDPEEVRAIMRIAIENRDFPTLADMLHTVAESVLWETEHNARWLACLEAVRALWSKYEND